MARSKNMWFLHLIDVSKLPYTLPTISIISLFNICQSDRWKGFPGRSEGKARVCNAGDSGSIPGLGRSPGEGNGSLLQYSCLENPLDRGAWWATVLGVTKSRTGLRDFTFHLGEKIFFLVLLKFTFLFMARILQYVFRRIIIRARDYPAPLPYRRPPPPPLSRAVSLQWGA